MTPETLVAPETLKATTTGPLQPVLRRNRVNRYFDSLRNMPPSGGGGCHSSLLSVANRGRHAGFSPGEIARDLAAHIHGTRKVSDREIHDAVEKAFDTRAATRQHSNFRTATPSPAIDGAKLRNAIIERGAGFTEVELWEASPVRIDWPATDDAKEVLQRLYRPDEKLFIGTRYDAGAGHVLPVSEWLARLARGRVIPEHICPNPLTGEQGLTKDGKLSFRADSCVARYRFAVVEFDNESRKAQIQFWAGVPLPVVALIDSGNKSIHGSILIEANSADEWTRRVEEELFGLLTVVGADAACKNEARLSRMPGHLRAEKNRWQRLLYLNPGGGPIIW